jgi:hypothetical protein
MKVTYFALIPQQIGDEWREPGDLVPEARDWAYRDLYLKDAKIAPVLVATLPKQIQDKLNAWEKEQDELRELLEMEAQEAAARNEAELVQQSIEANTPPPDDDEPDPVLGSQEGKVTIRRG